MPTMPRLLQLAAFGALVLVALDAETVEAKRVQPPVLTWRDVAFTIYGGCGVVSDGTVRCWGGDNYGHHGTGAETGRPTASMDTPVGLDRVTALAAGINHTCALRDDGTVWCWGLNDRGQAGQPPSPNSLRVPTQVAAFVDVSQLRAGGDVTCALAKGQVRCVGNNGHGMLGYKGKAAATPKPVPVPKGIALLAVGGGHACASKGGAVYCWGENAAGQLGRGTIGKASHRPTKVKGLPRRATVLELSAGNAHTCARLDSGQVWCWGFGTAFARLDGQQADIGRAVRVADDAGALALSTGPTQATCLLLASGVVRCAGTNAFGVLDGCPRDGVCASHEVAGLAGTRAIRFGHRHVCFVGDQVLCRGDSSYGVVHDGRTGVQATLAPIQGL